MLHHTGGYRWVAVGVILTLVLTVMGAGNAYSKVYRYKNADGVWVFTDRPEEVPQEFRGSAPAKTPPPAPPAVDLAKRLTNRFRPANPIEQAVLATVVVESPIGSGTGFFLTGEGHILTNAHVLRKTHRQKSNDNAQFDALAARVSRAADYLDEEKNRLVEARKQLDRLAAKARNGSRAIKKDYSEKEAAYAQWLTDHQDRQTDLYTARRRLADIRRKSRHEIRAATVRRHFNVRLADGTQLNARLVAFSDRFDLAMLKVDGQITPHLPIRRNERLAQSERVFAIGNPVTLSHSVSAGVFSGYRNGYLQTDAKVYPGNSGGPLLDASGRVVGITTFKKITHKYEGLGFAIPIQKAISVLKAHLPGR